MSEKRWDEVGTGLSPEVREVYMALFTGPPVEYVSKPMPVAARFLGWRIDQGTLAIVAEFESVADAGATFSMRLEPTPPRTRA